MAGKRTLGSLVVLAVAYLLGSAEIPASADEEENLLAELYSRIKSNIF